MEGVMEGEAPVESVGEGVAVEDWEKNTVQVRVTDPAPPAPCTAPPFKAEV